MDDLQLKNLFEKQEIPTPNDNKRKETLNLAQAAFEKNQKNEKISQGSSLWSRLISRQPTNRRDSMSFTKKKALYGGLATACVALLVYSVSPLTRLDRGASVVSDELMKVAQVNQVVPAEKKMEADDLKETSRRADVSSEMAAASMPEPIIAKDKAAKLDALVADRAEMEIAPQQMVAPSAPSPSVVAGASMPMGKLMAMPAEAPVANGAEFGRDKFKDFEQNAIKQVGQEPVSTFSIDVDTASYAFVRSNLDSGVLPQKDSVRVEELINYFDYDYPLPTSKEEPFKATVAVKPSPWHEGRKLVTVGIKGFDVEKATAPDSNLVFLLDVSGSMEEPNKLPLLKQSLSMLLDTLKPTDKASIVVYAGAAGTVLPPTPVSEKNTILMALQNLNAGGSTAGAEGIRQAYQLAETNFNKNAVNRVILATDGDFNVGITDPNELQDFIERKRDSGIFLSVLGFGRDNYNDDMMQRLAQNGNGVAAYIDTLNEARKVLVQEAGATLFPIAKDVKIQVEFNPATVSEYRLVGYETRALKTEDFNNDKVDAGDIGAGAEVTAIYEITPAGAAPAVDASRYAPAKADADKSVPSSSGELAFVKLRYKLPKEDTSKLVTIPVLPDMNAGISAEAQKIQKETDWAVAVASFGQLLKGGQYTGTMTYDDVLKLAQASKGDDPFGYRSEFINLIYKAKTAAALQSQPRQGGRGEVQPMPYQVQ